MFGTVLQTAVFALLDGIFLAMLAEGVRQHLARRRVLQQVETLQGRLARAR